MLDKVRPVLQELRAGTDRCGGIRESGVVQGTQRRVRAGWIVEDGDEVMMWRVGAKRRGQGTSLITHRGPPSNLAWSHRGTLCYRRQAAPAARAPPTNSTR